MKKYFVSFLLVLILVFPSFTVDKDIDTLKNNLKNSSGVEKIKILNELSEKLIEEDANQSIIYAKEAMQLSIDNSDIFSEIDSLNNIGYALIKLEKFENAIKSFQNAYGLSNENNYIKGQAYSKNGYGYVWAAAGDYTKALENYELSLELFKNSKDIQGEAYVNNNIGSVYESIGSADKALEFFINALKLNEQIDNKEEMATNYNNIGFINSEMNNFDEAFKYYSNALEIYEKNDNKRGMCDTYMNMGSFFRNFDYNDEAYGFYKKALKIAIEINSEEKISQGFINLASINEINGDFETALKLYNSSLEISKKFDSKEDIINAYNNIGTVYNKLKDYNKAIDNHTNAYDLAKNIVYKAGIESSLKNLANDYQKADDYQSANYYYVLYSEFKDALTEQENAKNFANSQTLYETEKKDKQISLQKEDLILKEKKARIQFIIIVIAGVFLLIVAVFLVIIAKEKKKSEKLLLNVLPKKVADDLKKFGKTKPKKFDNVTVYFSDVVGFTSMSSKFDPVFLIDELNDIFTTFDNIMEKHDCERIKTIGDAYFAVCGLPEANEKHAQNITNAALEIMKALKKRNETSEIEWRIRIGIHTGSLVGGVVGIKKYIYDLFGDTVNTASRMESNSEPMRINMSDYTYELVKDEYEFIERDPLEVKGKGMFKMYFLEGKKQCD
ncbi:adenylate/guanylate cyclase domain-containing protein [Helicovermis profundi]|uniref:Guanylate cyclase domain-containing protein n=1 Tax=Helicovermis profundi TaxID=3065157 RepID=A0AAU9EGL8_9FIRM|nr:hypothetical protein HLPR_09090 [Clostridia bacterium S502]